MDLMIFKVFFQSDSMILWFYCKVFARKEEGRNKNEKGRNKNEN